MAFGCWALMSKRKIFYLTCEDCVCASSFTSRGQKNAAEALVDLLCVCVTSDVYISSSPRPLFFWRRQRKKRRERERTGGGKGRGGVGNKQVCQAYHLLQGKSCVSACSALNRVWTWPDVIPSALGSKSNGPCLRWNQRAIPLPIRSLYSLAAFIQMSGFKVRCTANSAQESVESCTFH